MYRMYNEYTFLHKDLACRTKVIRNDQACRTRCNTLISVTQSLLTLGHEQVCKETWLVEQRVIYGVTLRLSIRFVEQACNTLISVTESLIAPTYVYSCAYLLIGIV